MISWGVMSRSVEIKPFQPSVAFHIETSNLIFIANQITCFYIKYSNTGLKWDKLVQ